VTEYCTLYVTVPDKAEAVALARVLIAEKLVACANISGEMLSLYPWDGEICQDHEWALFLKTRKDHAQKAIARIREQHSYDTPCIVQWDITGGNADYLKWLDDWLPPG